MRRPVGRAAMPRLEAEWCAAWAGPPTAPTFPEVVSAPPFFCASLLRAARSGFGFHSSGFHGNHDRSRCLSAALIRAKCLRTRLVTGPFSVTQAGGCKAGRREAGNHRAHELDSSE